MVYDQNGHEPNLYIIQWTENKIYITKPPRHYNIISTIITVLKQRGANKLFTTFFFFLEVTI